MSAPTLSPLRKGFAEAAKPASEKATNLGSSAGPRPPALRTPYNSRLLAALIGFALVNLCWFAAGFGRLEPEDFPFDTWTSCAVNDYLHGIKEPPNLAFLGSSLVLYPAEGVDADFLDRKIDAPRHHQLLYLENEFYKRTGQKISTFDFALPGEMPSDAYLINKFLLRGGHKPDAIVYGVGPRDFMETLLPSPSATDPYQHIVRFGDIADRAPVLMPDWQDRLNWELGRLIFPYGARADLVHSFERKVSQIAALPLRGLPAFTMADRRRVLPDYRRFETGVNECCFQSMVHRERPAFVDNLAEYRKRYKTLDWNKYLSQMGFLADTMEMARQRNIPFVLVSMPITELNRQLLTPQAREIFSRNLRVLAAAKGARFLDLDTANGLQLSEFEDTVHLNSEGGRKFFSKLSALLAADAGLRTAIEHGTPAPGMTAPGPSAADGKGKVDLATRRESYL